MGWILWITLPLFCSLVFSSMSWKYLQGLDSNKRIPSYQLDKSIQTATDLVNGFISRAREIARSGNLKCTSFSFLEASYHMPIS